jgi:hypothetical protein
MATFNSFATILPDPVYKITDAGNTDASGQPGPGFASVAFQSNGDTQVSRTISGRGVHRDQGTHFWAFTITYHKMTREQFDPVDAFLGARNARKKAFYVVLPQHAKPKQPAFAAYVLSNPNLLVSEFAVEAGISAVMIKTTNNTAISGNPRPGDFFNIEDATNANHLKTYKITRVETDQLYQAGTTAPTASRKRIHFEPPLQRAIAANAKIVFTPKFRVIMKGDLREYQLDTDNLYNFGLQLEEIQP